MPVLQLLMCYCVTVSQMLQIRQPIRGMFTLQIHIGTEPIFRLDAGYFNYQAGGLTFSAK
jgi:hypothetical protein